MKFRFFTRSALILFAISSAVMLMLSGCATVRLPSLAEQDIEAESLLQLRKTLTLQDEQEQQLLDLIWPLRVKNTQICKNMVSKSLGFSWIQPDMSRRSRKLSLEQRVKNSLYDFQDRAVVTKIAAGSPADIAGLQKGDRITRVGKWQWTQNKAKKFNEALSTRFDKLKSRGVVDMEVQRGSENIAISIQPIEACRVEINSSISFDVQAFTNGRLIVVTRGLMERLTEEEVRTVIAHELAHCVMGHLRKTALNSIAGASVDLAMLAQRIWLGGVFTSISRDMRAIVLEREADYVSMYLLANAGFDTSDRASIWRKLADELTFVMTGLTTHPHSPERYVLLTQAHKEIEAKRRDGRPLLPEGMVASK